jgi:lipopolysaccharide transport system permease protein
MTAESPPSPAPSLTAELAGFYTQLWRYRELIRNLVSRDLKVKYKSSVLGFFWSLLHPLAFLAIYSFAFMVVIPIKGIRQFPLFFICGYLPWTCLAQALSFSAVGLVDNAGLIKKVWFPRGVFPVSQCLTMFINFLLTFLVLFPVLWLTGHGPAGAYAGLPLLFAAQLLATIGLAFLLSILFVSFRDLQYLLELGLTLLFWLTPIVYVLEMVPQPFRAVIALNPLTHLMAAYRAILLEGAWPGGWSLTYLGLTALLLFLAGSRLFLRHEPRLAERV